MGLNIPPTIYVAGPNLNNPPLNSGSRGPTRHAPIVEPPSPDDANRAAKQVDSSSTGIEQPISLPDASGRLASSAKAGAKIDLRA